MWKGFEKQNINALFARLRWPGRGRQISAKEFFYPKWKNVIEWELQCRKINYPLIQVWQGSVFLPCFIFFRYFNSDFVIGYESVFSEDSGSGQFPTRSVTLVESRLKKCTKWWKLVRKESKFHPFASWFLDVNNTDLYIYVCLIFFKVKGIVPSRITF